MHSWFSSVDSRITFKLWYCFSVMYMQQLWHGSVSWKSVNRNRELWLSTLFLQFHHKVRLCCSQKVILHLSGVFQKSAKAIASWTQTILLQNSNKFQIFLLGKYCEHYVYMFQEWLLTFTSTSSSSRVRMYGGRCRLYWRSWTTMISTCFASSLRCRSSCHCDEDLVIFRQAYRSQFGPCMHDGI